MRPDRPPKMVPIEPFQERALELVAYGTTWSSFCDRMGWARRKDGSANTTAFKQQLGLVVHRGRTQRHLHYKTAVRLCHVLQCDPVDMGV